MKSQTCRTERRRCIPTLTKSTWPFYSLHSLERAGHLSNTEQIGNVDWKPVAMKQLAAPKARSSPPVSRCSC